MGGGAVQLAAAHFDESGPWSKAGEESMPPVVVGFERIACRSKVFTEEPGADCGIAAASPGCEVSC